MLVNAPPMKDGVQDIGLSDTRTGAASTMTGVLTYGAGPSDNIRLLLGTNPATPVGGQAPNPVRIPSRSARRHHSRRRRERIPDFDSRISLFQLVRRRELHRSHRSKWISFFSIDCPVSRGHDHYRKAGSRVVSIAKQVQTTLLGMSSSLDLSLASPLAWIAQGGTVGILLTARVLNNGVPINGATVGYKIVKGSGTLSAASGTTNAGDTQLPHCKFRPCRETCKLACASEPGNAPCQSFYGTSVPASALQMQAVSGISQELLSGTELRAGNDPGNGLVDTTKSSARSWSCLSSHGGKVTEQSAHHICRGKLETRDPKYR